MPEAPDRSRSTISRERIGDPQVDGRRVDEQRGNEERLADLWLDEQLEQWPVMATELGATEYDDEMADLSESGYDRRAGQDRNWAERLGAVDQVRLDAGSRLDVGLIVSELAGRRVMEDWQGWRRDPDEYLGSCLGGVFSLFLHRLRPEADLAASAVARLNLVPQVLADAQANLDPGLAHPLIVGRSLGSCEAGIAYARELVPAEIEDPIWRARVADAGATAADALEAFAAFLTELADTAHGDWAIGEARYSALLRDKEMLDYGAADMHGRGLSAWADLDEQMTSLATRIDPSAMGWRALVGELSRDHPVSPEALRNEYERASVAARQFLIEHDLVTLPDGERCVVEPSPVFQRPMLAVASYIAPPAFSQSKTGHFFVPFPPDGMTDKEIDELLSDNNFHSIPTTAVHEAYPGHHWHLTWIAQMASSRVRRSIWSSYFVEGWGLYAEHLMHEQGFFGDARQELCHLDARIFRAARIVVDTALHTGEMTFDEAVTYMSTKASLTEAVARSEVARYCAWPTQAASYLTGALEIERIRERYLSAGLGDLKSFHDKIAGSGGLPIALAERAAMGVDG